jgi:hypothetical protein
LQTSEQNERPYPEFSLGWLPCRDDIGEEASGSVRVDDGGEPFSLGRAQNEGDHGEDISWTNLNYTPATISMLSNVNAEKNQPGRRPDMSNDRRETIVVSLAFISIHP